MKRITLFVIGTILVVVLAATLFVTIRQALAAAEAERRWQATQVAALGDFGSTGRLEILPLYEEAGDQNSYQIGHGVAYLIKTDAATILMDVGNNPAEAEVTPLSLNMQALGISWDEIDAVSFSHFHPDHVGGVRAWRAGKVSLGKGAPDLQGKPVYAPSAFEFPGSSPVYLPDPTVLGAGIATIGSIAYGETFPISLYTAQGAEQVLAVNVEGKGIVLIMGCGHPIVERIVSRAEALFGQRVVGILGGFHYERESAKEMQSHIEFLQARDLLLVAPSPHDSSPEALQAFRSAFPEAYREVRVGHPIIFP